MSGTGETNLGRILSTLNPVLHPDEYIFTTISDPPSSILYKTLREKYLTDMICEFREPEGMTLVMKKSVADIFSVSYDYVARWITCKVHSSLSAVGLTSALSHALAEAGLSCNIIAGYYHDHLFVKSDTVDKAMDILRDLVKPDL